MDNRFATTLVIAGSGVMAASILAGAFMVGRLLLSLPVVNNSTDDYYIWLFLLSIALTVVGFVLRLAAGENGNHSLRVTDLAERTSHATSNRSGHFCRRRPVGLVPPALKTRTLTLTA